VMCSTAPSRTRRYQRSSRPKRSTRRSSRRRPDRDFRPRRDCRAPSGPGWARHAHAGRRRQLQLAAAITAPGAAEPRRARPVDPTGCGAGLTGRIPIPTIGGTHRTVGLGQALMQLAAARTDPTPGTDDHGPSAWRGIQILNRAGESETRSISRRFRVVRAEFSGPAVGAHTADAPSPGEDDAHGGVTHLARKSPTPCISAPMIGSTL
jgi:hypothetical protein